MKKRIEDLVRFFLLLCLLGILGCAIGSMITSCSFKKRFNKNLKQAVAEGLIDTARHKVTFSLPLAPDSCSDDSLADKAAGAILDRYTSLHDSAVKAAATDHRFADLPHQEKKKAVESAYKKIRKEKQRELAGILKKDIMAPARHHAFTGVRHFATADSMVRVSAWQKEDGSIAINFDHVGVVIKTCPDMRWWHWGAWLTIASYWLILLTGFCIAVILGLARR